MTSQPRGAGVGGQEPVAVAEKVTTGSRPQRVTSQLSLSTEGTRPFLERVKPQAAKGGLSQMLGLLPKGKIQHEELGQESDSN